MRTPFFIVTLTFALLQLLGLNHPRLSADEAIGGVLGMGFGVTDPYSLNPVLPYLGPLDILYYKGVLSFLNPAPWVLRIGPLLFFWVGAVYLIREVQKQSARRAEILAVLLFLSPLLSVHSRIGWVCAWTLGLSCLLTTEALHASRTGRLRWIRVGLWTGLGLNFHPTFGFAALWLGLWLLWENRAKPSGTLARLAGSAGLATLVAYPVLRNLPFPAGLPTLAAERLTTEINGVLRIVSGYTPFRFWYGRDPLIPVAALSFFALVWIAIRRFRKAPPATSSTRSYAVTLTLVSALIFYFCWRGRRLSMLGDERYVLAIAPIWIVLVSEAIEAVSLERSRIWKRIQIGLAVYAVAQIARLVLLQLPVLGQEDPLLLASRWLEKRCPKENCVVLAEDYWNYWPLRYYSGDRLAVRSPWDNWKEVSQPSLEGKRLAACWQAKGKAPEIGASEERVLFPAQDFRDAQHCRIARIVTTTSSAREANGSALPPQARP